MSGAEAVALAVSFFQIVDTFYAVVRRVKKGCSDTTVEDIKKEADVLSKIVTGLTSADGGPFLHSSAADTLQRQLHEIDQLVQDLKLDPDLSKINTLLKIIRSIRWDSRLRHALQKLERYKTTAILALMASPTQVLHRPDCVNDKRYEPTTIFAVPSPRRVLHFVGRGKVLDKISTAIRESKHNPARVVLTGIGGQGKTQTALEFCYQKQNQYGAIFWVDATAEQCTVQSFEKIAGLLGGGDDSYSNSVEFVKDRLREWRQRWLLVFDNYDTPWGSPNDIRHYFPNYRRHEKSAILVLRRNRGGNRIGTHIKLGSLTKGESIKLLKDRLGGSRLGCAGTAAAKEIVQELGHLPLAIDQATAFLQDVPLSQFLNQYLKKKEDILRSLPEEWEYKNSGCEGDGESLSVLTTWELSYALLDASKRDQIGSFLMLAAFLDHLNVREDLFIEWYHHVRQSEESIPQWLKIFSKGKIWSSRKFEDVVKKLVHLSLIQSKYAVEGVLQFTIHPMIKEWLQLREPREQREARVVTALSLVANFIKHSDVEGIGKDSRLRLLGQLDACLRNYKQHIRTKKAKGRCRERLEEYLPTISAFYARYGRASHPEHTIGYRLIAGDRGENAGHRSSQ